MKSLDDLATSCIRCGFCLEACPTFRLTGSEMESPRGRIYLARSAEENVIDWEAIRPHIDRCLGCLACETACPSGVEYGAILEIARDRLEQKSDDSARALLLDMTTSPEMLRLSLLGGAFLPGKRLPDVLSRALSGEDSEVDRPEAQIDDLGPFQGPAVKQKGEVYFLTGCAMRVLYPRVHSAAKRLLRRVGYVVREVDQGCCGALHAHNGHLDVARQLAEQLIAEMPGDLPVIVDSAGCGSTMKRYRELTEGGGEFASRVYDVSEFLFEQGLSDLLKDSPGLPNSRVTYHDACHLAHGQQIKNPPRSLIQAIPHIEFTELSEADTCCGSAGIYNVTQPKMARALLDNKMKNVLATSASIVATGNPGCHAWMAQGACEGGSKVSVLHTVELLEASFVGLGAFGVK